MNILDETLVQYCVYGDVEGVKKCLKLGANINTPFQSSNPLYEAVSKGNIEVVRELINHPKIQTNIYDLSTGYSALHSAVFFAFYGNQEEILELLIKNKSFNLKIPSKAPLTFGYTPLHLAAYIGFKRGAEILINAGAKIDDRTASNLTVLDVAGKSNSCKTKREDLISFLLNIQMKETV